jgi:hypothetical protein
MAQAWGKLADRLERTGHDESRNSPNREAAP